MCLCMYVCVRACVSFAQRCQKLGTQDPCINSRARWSHVLRPWARAGSASFDRALFGGRALAKTRLRGILTVASLLFAYNTPILPPLALAASPSFSVGVSPHPMPLGVRRARALCNTEMRMLYLGCDGSFESKNIFLMYWKGVHMFLLSMFNLFYFVTLSRQLFEHEQFYETRARKPINILSETRCWNFFCFVF